MAKRCGCVLGGEDIDGLTERVVAALLDATQPPGALAHALATELSQDWPCVAALALVLPFSLAGDAIESVLGGGPEARERAQDAWRIAALIGADVAVLQHEGAEGAGGAADVTPVTLARLIAHWGDDDPVFRRGDPLATG